MLRRERQEQIVVNVSSNLAFTRACEKAPFDISIDRNLSVGSDQSLTLDIVGTDSAPVSEGPSDRHVTGAIRAVEIESLRNPPATRETIGRAVIYAGERTPIDRRKRLWRAMTRGVGNLITKPGVVARQRRDNSEELILANRDEMISLPDQLKALYAGLDAAAPSAETWTAGLRAYKKAMRAGLGIDQARWNALDAAAPDSDYWKNGLHAIEASLVETDVVLDEAVTVPELEMHERHEILTLSPSASHTEKAQRRDSDGTGNEDTLLVDDTQRLYGVYDGAGGNGGNPAAASRAAADSLHQSLSDIYPRSKAEFLVLLKQSHIQAEKDVEKYGEHGTTVATTVKITEIDGMLYAGIAHAGDTRLFLHDAEGTITPLTPDQSRGNIIFNALSRYSTEQHDQFSVLELHKGDRLMMCSDGITGDWGHQLLSDSEFQDAFRQQTPAQCVARFVELSKKEDDKSIIVVDIVRGKN